VASMNDMEPSSSEDCAADLEAELLEVATAIRRKGKQMRQPTNCRTGPQKPRRRASLLRKKVLAIYLLGGNDWRPAALMYKATACSGNRGVLSGLARGCGCRGKDVPRGRRHRMFVRCGRRVLGWCSKGHSTGSGEVSRGVSPLPAGLKANFDRGVALSIRTLLQRSRHCCPTPWTSLPWRMSAHPSIRIVDGVDCGHAAGGVAGASDWATCPCVKHNHKGN